ncbi:MAG: hypothetical protein ACRENC_07135 [Gemmatimonadaceae bacterium]
MPALLAMGGVAMASPVASPKLAPLPQALPKRCEPLAKLPASATIPGPALSAHVSVAKCMAMVAMDDIAPAPDDVAIARLNVAVAPSIVLLDSVIGAGDPYWVLVAQDAKRGLYIGMIVRVRASLVNADSRAHDALEVRLAPWQTEASRATRAIIELDRSDPELARRDPVAAGIMSRAIGERGAR